MLSSIANWLYGFMKKSFLKLSIHPPHTPTLHTHTPPTSPLHNLHPHPCACAHTRTPRSTPPLPTPVYLPNLFSHQQDVTTGEFFKAEFNSFEFKIFLLPDWLPSLRISMSNSLHRGRKRRFGFLFGFYAISTFVGYLMPDPFLYKNQFYFEQFSLA